VLTRRRDDWALWSGRAPTRGADEDALYRAAVGWLGEVVRADFPPPSRPAVSPAIPEPAARREWLRQWRRLQLPDRMAAFGEELARARTETAVYATLTTHAARMVGGYLCLLFLPNGGSTRLRPVAEPRLRCNADALSITEPPAVPGVISEATLPAGGPYASLRPLFSEEGAAWLLLAPFGTRGTVVLVERRGERTFAPEDWDVLRILASQAEAALERVRLWEGVATLSQSDPLTGLGAGREYLHDVLAHAAAAAAWGEAVSVAVLTVDGNAGVQRNGESARVTRAVAEALRDAAHERGIVLRYAEDELLVVLPGLDGAEAEELVESAKDRLARGITVRARIVENAAKAARELAERARAAVPVRAQTAVAVA
jgi:GGDEF domain-containing protein